MTHFLTLLQENNLVSTVLRLLLAAVLGGLIGTERGAKAGRRGCAPTSSCASARP